MTENQQRKLGKVAIARRELLLSKLAEVKLVAEQARNKPTGGRRGRYLAALTLMANSDKGFIVLNSTLFANPGLNAIQMRFNQICKDLNRPNITVWEHGKTGERVLIDHSHSEGEYNFQKWLLKKDYGFTDEELRDLATAHLDNADEIEQENNIVEWIDENVEVPA